MVKQPVSETSAFTMSSEDFPALPGTTPTGLVGNNNEAGAQAQTTSTSLDGSSETRLNNQVGETPQKRGIITSPDGSIFIFK
jgi:CCR4-NOT transcription complex subunit 2